MSLNAVQEIPDRKRLAHLITKPQKLQPTRLFL